MDIDFIKKYVSLIERPAQTKTNIELIRIVEYGHTCMVETMFTDTQLMKLFPTVDVMRQVYAFVRDNQKLFTH